MEDTNYWQRLNRRRFSRRTALSGAGTLVLGGAAAMVVGCGGNGSGNGNGGPTRTPYTEDPKTGGSITRGRAVTVLGIDPHLDLTGLDIDVHLPVPIHLAARRRASHLQQPGGIAGAPEP